MPFSTVKSYRLAFLDGHSATVHSASAQSAFLASRKLETFHGRIVHVRYSRG